ncbi:MAG: uracil-DNA glycosylase [Planctomycetes bacterium]|nr:uracil-DNA glycosylase [Planctomycetota bacterium]
MPPGKLAPQAAPAPAKPDAPAVDAPKPGRSEPREPTAGHAHPPPPAPAAPTAPEPAPVPTQADPREAALEQLRREVLACTRCKLHTGRRHAVPGEGNPRARVMFIGEAPGEREDQSGRPFVGPAGQLLDQIITGGMGLQRKDVFIANINKCRPPGNREPEPDEVAACLPFLRTQVELVAPEVIVCLGRVAAQNLLGRTEAASKLRGLDLDYHGVPVVVTWHPAYLLREPDRKRETWIDIKRVNRLLGNPEDPRQKRPDAPPDSGQSP